MSDLTENDIFSCLIEHFREAEALCHKMAKTALRGRAYKRLIEVCKLIEGACRQAGHFRENHGWMVLGNEVHKLQIMMGGWIRAHYPREQAKKLFTLAAAKMARFAELAKIKKDKRHGRTGLILPTPGEGPARQRSVQVPRMTPGGIIIPDGVTLQ